MFTTPIVTPEIEEQRLKALYSYDILGEGLAHELDNLVKLAAQIANVPMASLSFVDKDEIVLKSVIGISTEYKKIPRAETICQYTMMYDDIFVVPDIALEPNLANNTTFFLCQKGINFYASAPLVDADGFALGCLVLFDLVPRSLSKHQVEALRTLAVQVIVQLALKRKNAQLVLQTKRLEEFLDIFTISPEIHCILDRNGAILFINNAVTSMLSYSVDEVIGKSMWDYCDLEDISKTIYTIEEGLKNKIKEFNIDFRLVSKTGQVQWIGWGMVSKGEKWYCYGRDITEKKRAEEELQVLSLVASKTNAGVAITNDKGEITWVNTALEGLIGYSLAELQGNMLGNLLSSSETDRELIKESRKKAINKQAYTIEVLASKKDGSLIWLSVANTPILDENGKLERQIELIYDITQRKQIEREMIEAREQALQLSEAKEMFLSVMSHEIRTPLNAVIGMTHLLLENEPKESQVDDLNILKFSGENLLNIINDILDFTKIETGNLQLEAHPFDLHTLCVDIINSLQVGASKKGNQLALIYDNKIPAKLLGDKTRLYQIIMNLLGNAIKFTDNGKVELIVKLMKNDDEESLINFEIKDNGIGIPKDKQSYIFETFTQARTDISRKYGGTGLGLAITKRLLKLYQSEIKVESTVGKGTIFSFAINFNRLSNSFVAPAKAALPTLFMGKKVLVVDDNEVNILIAKRFLSKWGLVLDFAYNGEEAINKIVNNVYDLVFMDIRMPGIDGFDATRIIREIDGDYYKKLPIIALTASTLHNENIKFKESGMNGHILKPFSPEEIKDVLASHFNK